METALVPFDKKLKIMHQTHILSNGLRIIHEPSRSEVLYCGYVVCAGTRHEDEKDSGMAHFIEHMTFKGTTHRKAWQITNGLERVGGDLNAYTTKQETVYYATILRQDFRRAADLLTDIVFNSTFPQHEIDKEVEVICDEIDSYKDSPSELIFDEFESLIFPNHPLGRDILGSKERLHEYRTADALLFTHRYYQPNNCVFFVYGNVDFNRIVRTLEKLTEGIGSVSTNSVPRLQQATAPIEKPREAVTLFRHHDTHQAHVLIGNRTFGGRDPRRYGLFLLNNILGGPGMNSRFNLSLREHAGLVYSVDSYLATYPDEGLWEVYFGCDVADGERCRRLINKELRRMVEKPLTQNQLNAALKQVIGQIGISDENLEQHAIGLGKSFAHYGRYQGSREVVEHLRELTPQQLQEIAAEVYDVNRLTTLVYN